MAKGLFERWLEIERSSGRPMTEILSDINQVCGTKYRHNWPSKMAQSGHSMDRVPTGVRQYMMTKVLAQELQSRGLKLSPGQDEALSFGLRNSMDALRLYDYARAQSNLPEMADEWTSGQRKAALGYDPLEGKPGYGQF